jgi:hypothetical protein
MQFPVAIWQGAGWAPEPFWKQRQEEISFVSAGDRTPILQFVATHYTDSATPALR